MLLKVKRHENLLFANISRPIAGRSIKIIMKIVYRPIIYKKNLINIFCNATEFVAMCKEDIPSITTLYIHTFIEKCNKIGRAHV